MNVLAVGNGSSSRIWRERSGQGPAARESGASPRGMAAAAVAFLAALLLLPGEARAQQVDACGTLTGGSVNCEGPTLANGARYNHAGSGAATVNVGSTGTAGTVTITANQVYVYATGGDATINVGGVSTVNSGGTGNGFNIYRGQTGTGASTITIQGDVNIGSIDSSEVITWKGGRGVTMELDPSSAIVAGGSTLRTAATIYSNAVGIYFRRDVNAATTADSIVENTGAITSNTDNGIWASYERPGTSTSDGDFRVTNRGDITAETASRRGLSAHYHGYGAFTVEHLEGAISSGQQGIFVEHGASGAAADEGVTTINIGGDITSANNHAVQLYQTGGTGAITVSMTGGKVVATPATAPNSDAIFIERAVDGNTANSGTMSVTTTGGSLTGKHGIRVQDNAMYTGEVTISNGADIIAADYGIHVERDGNGATTVTNTGGEVVATANSGIFVRNLAKSAHHVTVKVEGGEVRSNGQSTPAVAARNEGTGNVTVTVSGDETKLISKYNAGIFARLWEGDADTANDGSKITVTQGGEIQGRRGVYAFASPHSTAETVAARAASAQPLIDITWSGTFSHGVAADVSQDDANRFVASSVLDAVAIAQEVETEKHIRYGSPAGIEAQVMPWRDVMRLVASGDDPGASADVAAALAGADGGAIREAFKAVLATADLDTIPGAADIDTDGTTGLSDPEIDTYLTANAAVFRNVLAQGFTDEEAAVLKAVVTNTGLDAALTAAGHMNDDADTDPNDHWSMVKALLDRYNVGNIRVNMTGGSIDSRGDGIRAYYATPNDNNGSIDVTVAAGTTVTGGMAGIYVANAGAMGTGTDRILKQTVTVNGMVTGGTDAAVHLAGGGTLTVGASGKVMAGSEDGDSGVAIKVNAPGRSVIEISGEVTGNPGEGSGVVVLEGGGTLTIQPTGSVMAAAGAAGSAVHAIGDEVVRTVIYASRLDSRDDVDKALARLRGWVTGSVVNENNDGQEGEVTVRTVTVTDAAGNNLSVPTGTGDEGGPNPRALAAYNGLPQCTAPQVPTADGSGCMDDPDQPTTTPPTTTPPTTTPPTTTPPTTTPPTTTPTELTTDCDLARDNCRLYEALPSMLLSMNDVPTYAERMSAARDARGGWARVEAARGKWKADTSTQPDVAYDHSRSGLRAGMDFAAGDAGRVGVSVHGLRGSAEMTGVGEVDLSGAGLGVHVTTALDGGVHVDMQAAVTWYHADLKSTHPAILGMISGNTLKNDVNGRGYALGVEVGKRLPGMGGGVAVTPRAGLRWSKAGLDDFTDEARRQVSMKDAQSLKGRAGVGVEKVLDGAGMDGSRLFASLDVEQEFKEETEANVVGSSPLKASARKTRIRTAAGAVHVWDEGRYSLQGSLGYTAGGGGNRDFGGGLSLAVKF